MAIMEQDLPTQQPIAVVGISFGFPSATNSDAFWKLLMSKRNVSQDFPKSRLSIDQIYHPDASRRGQIPVRGGHFLEEDIALFDAPFFGITPDEAAGMDPQQRGLLEHTYLALENAGIPMENVSGTKTSVYTGCFTNDWQHIQFKDTEQCGTTLALGAQPCVNANRISWFFNFTGNSCNVDTACSSSLVCLDMGVTGLLAHDTEMSIVAGCNLIFSPDMMHSLCAMNMLSPSSKCFSFDHRANGYSRGEGFGVLVLKRLNDALRDGNTIQAIIRSTGCNQDGNTPGITMPSPVSQEALIRDTYRKAGLSMLPTRYFEAHGTGTAVGDPIESAALGRAFRGVRTLEDPLVVGALKSNIGHLEGAAGIAGVIKAILVLQRGVIPPNTNFEKVNPKIDAEFLRIKFPLEAMPWPAKGLRRASVNSFGFGGTNAHVVLDDVYHFLEENFLVGHHNTVRDPPTLEEIHGSDVGSVVGDEGHQIHGANGTNGVNGANGANGANGTNGANGISKVNGTNGINGANGTNGINGTNKASPVPAVANGHTTGNPTSNSTSGHPQLILLSSFDEKGTSRLASQLSSHLSHTALTPSYLANLTYTLNHARSLLPYKSFAVLPSPSSLPSLSSLLSPAARSKSHPSPSLALIFTGQGAQHPAMGASLLSYPAFASSLAKSQTQLYELGCPWGLVEELLRPAGESRINRPEFSQPVCTAVQLALVDLLRTFGIRPAAVVGHSSGEIAAAYAVGALSGREAVGVAYYRGVCAARLAEGGGKRGGMLAVGLSVVGVGRYIQEVEGKFGVKGLTVACVNSPKNVTVSGDVDQIDVLREVLDQEGVFARKLVVDVAYHSPHMEAVAEEYRSLLQGMGMGMASSERKGDTHTPVMISSVTGKRITPAELTNPDYWVSNLVSPVQFTAAVTRLFSTTQRGTIRKKLDLSHKNHVQVDSLLEVGPHAALQGPVRDILTALPGMAKRNIGYSSALVRKQDARLSLMEAMGRLRCAGHAVDLWRVNNPTQSFAEGKRDGKVKILTDLPGYVFDHSEARRYWFERRLGRAYRTHTQNKWDLLGKPVPDWNPLEAKWRNVLRVSEMPWVEDHLINKALVYPGAGMLVMAIEGARQLATASSRGTIKGYEVKDCSFRRALAIPQDNDGVEVQLTIRASQDGLDSRHSWSAFRICVFEDDADGGEWKECCHGYVRVEYEGKIGDVIGDKEQREQLRMARELDDNMAEDCNVEFDPKVLYQTLQDSGFGFGPSFQPIVAGACGGGKLSRADIRLFEWPANQYPQEHIIHPTSLDGILHLSIAGVAEGGRKSVPTMIPTMLRKLWINAKGLSYSPDTRSVKACTWMTTQDNRGWEFDCSVLSSPARDEVLATFQGLRLTIVSDNSADGEEDAAANRQVCYNVEYRPDPDITIAPSVGSSHHADCLRLVDAIAHKSPGLSVLHLDCAGSVNESLSPHLLATLSEGPSIRYSQFVHAAPSDDALAQAKEDLKEFSGISFQTIDLASDATGQELAAGAFNVVVVSKPPASATPAFVDSIRKLLRPDGWLVVHDNKSSLDETAAAFGIGDASLAKGPEFIIDVPGSMKKQHAITAQLKPPVANGAQVPRLNHVVLVVDASELSSPTPLAQSLQTLLDKEGLSFSVQTLEQAVAAGPKPGTLFISLLEMTTPFLYELSSEGYASLRQFLMQAKDILWLNPGGGPTPSPEYAIINGIARVIRNEYDDTRFSVLQLEVPNPHSLSETQLEMVATTLRLNHLLLDDSDVAKEYEFVEINSTLHIPRVITNPLTSNSIHTRSLAKHTALLPLQSAPPLALTVGTPGLLDTLHFIEDPLSQAPLSPSEIEVRALAIGMNFKDVLIALGQVPGLSLGLECAGVVTRVGSNVTDLAIGDRVLCIAPIATYARCHASAACRIPDAMSFEEAAAIPAQFGTAWEVVHNLARLRAGETILIHAGAGGTGQAAVQIAKHLGAGMVLVTVGSSDKKELVMREYGIPEEHVFWSRDTSFAKGVMRVTGGRGVDVVVNSLGGEGLVASWGCVAAYGRFVEIGKRDIMANANLPMAGFAKNASFIGFDATTWHKARPVEARESLKRLVALFGSGVLHTARPLHLYDISEVEDVFRLMQDGKTAGKIVMRVRDESVVRATLETKPSFFLEANATYVIAGGLGGLGRSVARWMADRGAKNLVLLSRSGPRTEEARAFLAELRDRGVRAEAPACDVTDLEAMRKVFDVDLADMPPVKGCIQGSMVRRDELLENLTFDAYNLGAACKTIGSWNLHSVLPSGLDFFILLSSASGLVGLRGQTNYNAGNTYEDALARYRVSRGEKAISLDLGAMIDDGLLAENPELLKRVLVYGALNPVTRRQFFAILDYFCDPSRPIASPAESQVVIGLGTGGGTGLDAVDLGKYPIFRHMAVEAMKNGAGQGGSGEETINYAELIAASPTLVDAANIIVDALVNRLARSLSSMEGVEVDVHKPLHTYGVDSLLAIELRKWMAKEFKADIAVFEVVGGSTFSALGVLAAGRSGIQHPAWHT